MISICGSVGQENKNCSDNFSILWLQSKIKDNSIGTALDSKVINKAILEIIHGMPIIDVW